MSLRRVPVLAAVVLSLGGVVALANPDLLFSSATAQNTEQPRQPDQPRPAQRKAPLQELNLTPEQTQRLEAIQNQYRDQIDQRMQAVRQGRQELINLMAGTAPESQVREKYRQVETLKQQAEEVRFNSFLAMRDVLTPEQRRQFAERMQNLREYKHRGRSGGQQGTLGRPGGETGTRED